DARPRFLVPAGNSRPATRTDAAGGLRAALLRGMVPDSRAGRCLRRAARWRTAAAGALVDGPASARGTVRQAPGPSRPCQHLVACAVAGPGALDPHAPAAAGTPPGE